MKFNRKVKNKKEEETRSIRKEKNIFKQKYG